MTDENGHQLSLGYYSVNYYFFAGVWHSDQYVLYYGNEYAPLPEVGSVEAKLLPSPLPSYSTVLDKFEGFSLWIMLGLLIGGYTAATYAASRPKQPVASQATEAEALYRQCLKGVLVTMMLRGGQPTAQQREMIRTLYHKLFSVEFSDAELDAEIDRSKRQNEVFSASIERIAPLLNDEGKEMVLRSALLVALAGPGDHLGDNERECFSQIASALRMTSDHINRVVNSLSETSHVNEQPKMA